MVCCLASRSVVRIYRCAYLCVTLTIDWTWVLLGHDYRSSTPSPRFFLPSCSQFLASRRASDSARPRPSIQRLDPELRAVLTSVFPWASTIFYRPSHLCDLLLRLHFTTTKDLDYRWSCLINVLRVNVSDHRFKRPNPERRAREERRFQAELVARSAPALAARLVVAAPEAQKRGKRRGKPQKRSGKRAFYSGKKRREMERCRAAARTPPRDLISHPSRPAASSITGYFKLPPLASPKAPFWTSTIRALNEPPSKRTAYNHRTFPLKIAKPPWLGYNFYSGRRITRKILATPKEGQTRPLPS